MNRHSVLARYDRQFDPSPDGDRIAFLPFDSTAKSNFFLFGADYRINEGLNLIPNVEWICYDAPDGGSRPDHNLVPRVTFFYRF